MVLLIDLDEQAPAPGYNGHDLFLLDHGRRHDAVDAAEFIGLRRKQRCIAHTEEAIEKEVEEARNGARENPNLNEFSAALGCYPVVSQITYSVDLNTLHALSRTCRQFRANLLQFRRQLVTQSLRCDNEEEDAASTEYYSNSYSRQPWGRTPFMTRNNNENAGRSNLKMTSGKVGRCARDMVGPCRRCNKIVCRNCIIKAPPTHRLINRHRRLCDTCLTAPLYEHTTPVGMQPLPDPPAFTARAFLRTPCSCAESVWLCLPCGQAIASSDTTYRRGWAWRTSYGTRLFGLGTGIGEGIHGVHCGRETECLAAKESEFENDCDAQELQRQANERGELGPSYLRQEIEGIGGVVKQKVKKRLRVGAIVKAHDDEMARREYLGREERGEERSWCGWCSRVIPSIKDQQQVSWA